MDVWDVALLALLALIIVLEGFAGAVGIRHDLTVQREIQRTNRTLELLVADVLAASPQLEETVSVELEGLRAHNRQAAALLAAFGKFEKRRWVSPLAYARFEAARRKLARKAG